MKTLLTNSIRTAAVFTVFLSSILSVSSQALSAETPNPREITIRDVKVQGDGCPSDTASVILSPDAKSLTLLFDHFITEIGQPGSINPVDRKTCTIDLDISAPAGWSYAIFGADYRGFASLEANTMGIHEVVYSFGASADVISFSAQNFRGPIDQDYTIHNSVPLGAKSWSSCQNPSPLRLTTTIMTRLMGRPGPTLPKASMTLDSIDGSLEQEFDIQWRPCNQVPLNQTVKIHRFNSPTDFLLTTDTGEGLLRRLPYGGQVFKVYKQAEIGLVPLLRCLAPDQRTHFLSTDARCDGGRRESLLGMISAQPRTDHVALQRFSNPRMPWMKLSTTDATEAQRLGYRLDGIQGYVPSKDL